MHRASATFAASLLAMSLTGPAALADNTGFASPNAQQINAAPADQNSARSENSTEFKMKPLTITGQMPTLKVNEPVGSYNQPLWTTRRRFASTRAYVRPEGSVSVEQWFVTKTPRHNGITEFTTMSELELGLPHRFQLDIYLNSHTNANEQHTGTRFNQMIELRYALADWGKLFGNPTFYIEYHHKQHEADAVETKLLFSGDLGKNSPWHWATNLIWEHTAGGDQNDELGWNSAVAYTLMDNKLSLGAELEASIENSNTNRSTYTEDILLGPSIQYIPADKVHIDFAPLFGVTTHSNAVKIYLVLGFDF